MLFSTIFGSSARRSKTKSSYAQPLHKGLRRRRRKNKIAQVRLELLEDRRLLAIANAGFETGTLAGWTATGPVSVVTNHTTSGQTKGAMSGNQFAVLTAGLGESVPTTLSQTFSATSGQNVQGWAFFDANDYLPYNDSGYVRITQGNVVLFSSDVASVGNYNQTPWTAWSYTIPSSGNYTLEAGVKNVGDNAAASQLGIDLVALTVPVDANAAVNSVSEGAANGTPVGVTAFSSHPAGASVTYSLANNAGGRFAIHSSTGVVTVANSSLLDGPANHSITVQATDSTGGTASAIFTIAVTNIAPTATFNTPATATEGSAFAVSLTNPSDASTQDTNAGFEYAFDFGSGYGSWSTSNSVSFTPPDDGNYVIKGRIRDKDGSEREYTATVSVLNVSPALTLSGAVSTNEGSVYTLNLAASDPGSDTISKWTVTWGDGSPAQEVPGNPSSVTHTYEDGTRTFTILATATDEDGTYAARASGNNAQASLDPSFGNSGEVTHNFNDSTADFVRDTILMQADGKVLLVGYTQGGNNNIGLARFNADGSLDTSFGTGGKVVTDFGSYEDGASALIQADGRILVGGNFGLARYLSDGSLDIAFGNGGRLTTFTGIQKIVQDSDGKILASGGYRFARFLPSGAFDLTFGNNGIANTSQYFADFTLDPSGGIVTVGQTGNVYPQYNIFVQRYTSTGMLDSGFATGGTYTYSNSSLDNSNFYDIGQKVVIHQGKILVGGSSDDIRANGLGQYQSYGRRIVLLRLDTSGVPDVTFDTDGVKLFSYGNSNYDYFYSMSVDSEDRIMVSGNNGLYRFAADGSYEAGLNNNAGRTFNSVQQSYGVAPVFDAAGRIYLGGPYYQGANGEGYNFGIQRFNNDGTTDPSFDSDSVAHTDFVGPVADYLRQVIVRQSGGKIVVAGYKSGGTTDLVLARYNTDGSLDTSFGTDAANPGFTILEQQNSPTAAEVDAAGRIYVSNGSYVRRYSPDGALDGTFNNNSGLLYAGGIYIQSLKFDGAGRLLVGGYKYQSAGSGLQSSYDFAVARYTADGVLDSLYGAAGFARFDLNTTDVVRSDQFLYDIAVDSAGRVIAVGYSYDYNTATQQYGNIQAVMARFDANGAVDSGFGTSGSVLVPSMTAQKVVLDGQNRILIGISSQLRRYNDNGTLDTTFSGDGIAQNNVGTSALQVDGNGKIIAAGSGYLSRWNDNGTPDTTFAPNGQIYVPYRYINAISIDASNRIMAVGQTDGTGATGVDFWLARFITEGLAIRVDNVAPQNLTIAGPTNLDEGGNIELTASATDPAGAADPLTYSWNITRNGSAYLQVSGAAISFDALDNGTYVATVSVNDGDGGIVVKSHTILVDNVAPTATFNAPAEIDEGSVLTLSLTAPGDASSVDAAAGFTYAFDFGGGYGAFSTSSSANVVPSDNGTRTVKGKMRDKDGGITEYTATITVDNVAPAATITGAPATSPEGTAITVGNSVSDLSPVDTFTYAWSVTKDGDAYAWSTNNDFTFTPDDNGSYVVTLTVTDDDGGVGSDSETITVTNAAPTATITGAPATSPEGTAITVGNSVSDLSPVDTFTYAWSVTKDGDAYASSTNDGFTFTPDDNGSYVVTLTVTDDDGGVTSDSTVVTIKNVAPTIAISGETTVSEGASYTLNLGTVADPGADTVSSYIVHWGDGSSDTYNTAGAKTHIYADGPDSHAISVALVDEDGTHPVTLVGTASPTSWSGVAPLPVARGFVATATGPDGRIYAMGGIGPGNDGAPNDAVYAYSPVTDAWTEVAPMLTPRAQFSAATGSDGRIYAIGGFNAAEGTVEAYSPSTNTWTSMASMPTVRYEPAVVSGADGKIYVLGGYDKTLGNYTSGGYAYDPATDSWATIASMPAPRGDFAAAVGPDGLIYAVGGRTSPASPTALSTVFVYTPSTDTWTTVASLPVPSTVHTAATGPDGRIYAINVAGSYSGAVYAYSPDTDTWAAFSSLPNVHSDSHAVTGPDGHIYVIGGWTGSAYTNKVDRLEFEQSPAHEVLVTNVAPTVTISGAVSANEGETQHYTFTTSDPGDDTFSVVATSGGAVGTVSNLVIDSATGAGSFDVTFSDGPITSTVSVQVQDSDGAASNVATVDVTVANVVPSVSLTGSNSAEEGQTQHYTFTASDPGTDTLDIIASGGEVGVVSNLAFDALTGSGSFDVTFSDGPVTSTVSVEVIDSDGASSKVPIIDVVVANVAPTIGISGASNVNEGSSYSLTLGAVTDPGADTVSSYVVHWGDGSSDTYDEDGVQTHTYADGPNSYAISVDLVDEDGTFFDSANALTVTVDNVAPVAVFDDANTLENDSVTKDVIDNDTDVGTADVLSLVSDSAVITAMTRDSDSATIALNTASVTQSGKSITFDPGSDFDFLAVGETATVLVAYQVTDDDGDIDDGVLTISVTGANDAPVAVEVHGGASEDGPAVNVSAAFTDVDAADTHTFAIDTTGTLGLVIDNDDGTFTYNPNGQFESLAVGETATDSFDYAVADEHGISSNATVTITITGVNDAPVMVDAGLTANEDGAAVTTIVLADDVDSDDDASSLTYAILSGPSAGSAVSNDDGTFTFDPGSAFQDLAAGEIREVSFTVQATDRHGQISNISVVTVTITGVNDAPVTVDAELAANEDGAVVSTGILASDIDSDDDASTLTYAILSGPSEGSAVSNDDGTFTFDPGSAFQDLAADETRVVSFTVQATDRHGDVSNISVVTVTITGVNDAPVASDDNVTTTQDGSVSGNVLANDTDVDTSDTRVVSAVNGSVAAVGQPVATAHGVVTLNADGTFTYTPGIGCEATEDSFEYTVSDGNGGFDTATVTVTINQYTGVADEEGILRVSGGDGVDIITVSGGNLIVNGVAHSLDGVTEVRIWGRGGNDTIDLTGLGINSFIQGGDGNDSLTGGSANDVIFGGLGDDTITGAAGHDFLIGGTGKDRIVGSAGNDILVSGEVSCSLDLDTLRAISAVWAAQAADEEAADDVLDESVIGDEDSDMLTGSSGADLFFISSNDKITDFKLDKSGASKDGDVVIVVE